MHTLKLSLNDQLEQIDNELIISLNEAQSLIIELREMPKAIQAHHAQSKKHSNLEKSLELCLKKNQERSPVCASKKKLLKLRELYHHQAELLSKKIKLFDKPDETTPHSNTSESLAIPEHTKEHMHLPREIKFESKS